MYTHKHAEIDRQQLNFCTHSSNELPKCTVSPLKNSTAAIVQLSSAQLSWVQPEKEESAQRKKKRRRKSQNECHGIVWRVSEWKSARVCCMCGMFMYALNFKSHSVSASIATDSLLLLYIATPYAIELLVLSLWRKKKKKKKITSRTSCARIAVVK